MVGLLFPGQGSQYVGMGRDLAERFPLARRTFEEADEVLGLELSRVAWEGPETELTLTKNAQPAILVHSVAVWRVLGDRVGGVCCAAGHSLGEFSAYVAAGTLSFGDAVRTVRRRGELMFESGEARPGSMAAILGLDDAGVEDVCSRASNGSAVCVAANYNAPGQVVISGDVEAVERAVELAREAGARRAMPLNVSGAFHSPLMEEAVAGLAAQLDGLAIADPRFPVVSNVTASLVSRGEEARDLLLRQLTSPVRWTASMRAMLDSGADSFLELGPGTVLAGLLRRVERGWATTSLATAEQVTSWLESQ